MDDGGTGNTFGNYAQVGTQDKRHLELKLNQILEGLKGLFAMDVKRREDPKKVENVVSGWVLQRQLCLGDARRERSL